MAKFKFTIGGEDYQGATAPAVDQYEALHIACNSKLIVGMQDGLPPKAALLHLMAVPLDKLNKLIELLVEGNVAKAGTDIEVAVNLFKDKPEQWGLLILEVCKANLAGFYKLHAETNDASAGTDVKPEEQPL